MGELKDKTKGAVKEGIGEAKQHSNNPETRAEGRRQEIDGKTDKAKGEVKGAMGNDV